MCGQNMTEGDSHSQRIQDARKRHESESNVDYGMIVVLQLPPLEIKPEIHILNHLDAGIRKNVLTISTYVCLQFQIS
ncbi:hypothetical protein C0J52_21395 [Blattella germanica]|nr:hypothetical protein C0J52_21395 [Blattella germanica]